MEALKLNQNVLSTHQLCKMKMEKLILTSFKPSINMHSSTQTSAVHPTCFLTKIKGHQNRDCLCNSEKHSNKKYKLNMFLYILAHKNQKGPRGLKVQEIYGTVSLKMTLYMTYNTATRSNKALPIELCSLTCPITGL